MSICVGSRVSVVIRAMLASIFVIVLHATFHVVSIHHNFLYEAFFLILLPFINKIFTYNILLSFKVNIIL